MEKEEKIAILDEELENDVRKYLEENFTSPTDEPSNIDLANYAVWFDEIVKLARHFAEWGLEHAHGSSENPEDQEVVAAEKAKEYALSLPGGERLAAVGHSCAESGYYHGFNAGATWQFSQLMKRYVMLYPEVYRYYIETVKKEQMEKLLEDAISCKVFWYDGPLLDYTQEQQDDVLERIGAHVGDSVKLIILKDEDNQ